MNSKNISKIIKNCKIELFIAILTLFIFSINILDFPFQGEIYYAYIGQEILRGNPVFSTSVAPKPPVIYFFDAFLMKLFFFLPNYLAIRVGMTLLSSISMVLFYKLIKKITSNNLISIFSVLITLSFIYFIEDSLNSGLKPFIFFLISLEFLYLFRKNYLVSSFFASMSFMTWQPSGLLITAPVVYCFLNQEGIKKYFKILIGFSIPVILVVLYFFINGSLGKFIDYVFILPLSFNIQRFDPTEWLRFRGIFGYYNTELIFLLFSSLGAVLVVFEIVKKIRNNKNPLKNTKFKRLIAFLVPFFLLLLYSIFDFQGADDIIILLPAISFFAAVFLATISKKNTIPLVIIFIILYGFFPYLQPVYPENKLITDSKEAEDIGDLIHIASNYKTEDLIYFTFFHRKGEEMNLKQQLEMAEYIKANTEIDEKIFSIGAPEILFISNKRNINEYYYLSTRIYTENVKREGILIKLKANVTEENPKFIVARNVWMNQRVIDLLDIGDFLKDNYMDISTHPEYVIWERK